MKATGKVSFLLFASHWKRTLSFLCLIVLLSVTAGLLGNRFLYDKETLDPVAIAVVDLDKSPETQMLFPALSSAMTDGQMIDLILTTEDEAEVLLKNGDISAVFVVPQGFFKSILNGENLPLEIAYNPYTPLQSSIIETFVNQILTVLQSAQTGIYTVINYAEEFSPEQAEALAFRINARYINAVSAYNHMILPKEVSFTGVVSPFYHYLFAMFVVLLLLGCCLFFPLLQKNFPPQMLLQLRQQGISPLNTTLGWVTGWFAWYAIVGFFLIALYKLLSLKLRLPFSIAILPAMLLVLLWVTALGVFLHTLFGSTTVASSVLVLYSIVSLFFAGGILPLQLTHPLLQCIAKGFPSYWSTLLLGQSLKGTLPLSSCIPLLVTTAALLLGSTLCLHLRTKEGTP